MWDGFIYIDKLKLSTSRTSIQINSSKIMRAASAIWPLTNKKFYAALILVITLHVGGNFLVLVNLGWFGSLRYSIRYQRQQLMAAGDLLHPVLRFSVGLANYFPQRLHLIDHLSHGTNHQKCAALSTTKNLQFLFRLNIEVARWL